MHLRRAAFATLACLLAFTTARAQEVHLKIAAINDFHGNLQSPGKMSSDAQSPQVAAGGVAYLAGYVEHILSENPNHIAVGAGDLVGASPLVSALFHDEPSIEAMNRMGLELTSVGNHEFDKGKVELLRKQHGGCFPHDDNTCKGALVGTPVPFEGARFQYLAANVIDTATNKTLFPPYAIKTYGGIKVAFIGLTLTDTPSVVLPSGVAGLRFLDEATTINGIVHKLRAQGVKSFVVLIHQGGFQTRGANDINGCDGALHGTPIEAIVNKLDDAVGLVISAHTHQAYICQVPNAAGRNIPVTSAASYGRLVTDIDVTLSKRTRAITAVTAHNILIDRTNPAITPDPAIKTLVDKYAALAAPLVNRPVGSITAGMTRHPSPAGESALGDLIADGELNATANPATGGAVAAFMNSGGIRTDLPFASGAPTVPAGKVTYGEVFGMQPFGNILVTLTLTGDQLHTLLEEQFAGCMLGYPADKTIPPPDNRVLQISASLAYTWNPAAPTCAKVDPAGIKINGVTINPATSYRITVNNFLADGGDAFYILRSAKDRLDGPSDLDALDSYLGTHPSLAPPAPTRIQTRP